MRQFRGIRRAQNRDAATALLSRRLQAADEHLGPGGGCELGEPDDQHAVAGMRLYRAMGVCGDDQLDKCGDMAWRHANLERQWCIAKGRKLGEPLP